MARDSVAAVAAEPERTQKMKERAQIAKERRSSVLPATAPKETTDTTKVDDINSEEQLEAFVKERCSLVLQMIQALRVERDEGIQCAKDVSFLIKKSEEQQKHNAEMTQELEELYRAREATSETMSGNSKRHVKWPDAPMLTGDTSLTFTMWVPQMIKKCQKDFPDSLEDQIDYALSRTGGKVLEYLEPRIHPDADPFVSLDDLLEYLAAWLKDPDPKATARQKLRELKQGREETFATFYDKWLTLMIRLSWDESSKIDDLCEKILPRLRVRWDNIVDQPTTVSGTYKALTKLDNAMRATDKLHPRPEPSKATISKYQTPGARVTSASTKKDQTNSTFTYSRMNDAERQQLMQEGRCFACKQAGHLSINCPTKPSRRPEKKASAWIMKVNNASLNKNDSSDSYSSKND